MRILITTFPAYGHFYPMLPIARAAQHAGHEVVIATGPDLTPHVEQLGFPTWPVGHSGVVDQATFRARPDRETLPPEERIWAAVSGLFVPAAAKRATDLVPRAMEWKPDVVINEVLELAGGIAAARSGARHVVHSLGLPVPAWSKMLSSAFEPLCAQWQVPELADALYYATYLDICPPSLQPEDQPVWHQVHPLRPAVGEAAPSERLPEALTALPHADTVYLTLGTVFHDAPGVFETVLAGLQDLPLNIVVTTGPDSDPARLGRPARNVVIERYIPQALLLAQCRLVISHGGAGTMFGALSHGLPQLLLPQGADQFWNAAACQRVGVALTLPPDKVCAHTVATSVQQLITEPAFTVATRRIQDEINAMPAATDVLASLLPTDQRSAAR
jgi:UDP:flavonoid glycosyltransferase YjiC (YdhE family)